MAQDVTNDLLRSERKWIGLPYMIPFEDPTGGVALQVSLLVERVGELFWFAEPLLSGQSLELNIFMWIKCQFDWWESALRMSDNTNYRKTEQFPDVQNLEQLWGRLFAHIQLANKSIQEGWQHQSGYLIPNAYSENISQMIAIVGGWRFYCEEQIANTIRKKEMEIAKKMNRNKGTKKAKKKSRT